MTYPPNSLLCKRLDNRAVVPTKAHPEDAGFDITAISRRWEGEASPMVYETGLAIFIPEGYVGILKERSSIRKYGLVLVGGVIDSGYVGPIEVSFQYVNKSQDVYAPGDRVCQLVVTPIHFLERCCDIGDAPLAVTARGTNGFGSTGN